MSTITYDTGPGVRAAAPVAAKRKGYFARFLARMVAARQRQAREEIRRYGIKLPSELEDSGFKLNERSEDSLPFVR